MEWEEKKGQMTWANLWSPNVGEALGNAVIGLCLISESAELEGACLLLKPV